MTQCTEFIWVQLLLVTIPPIHEESLNKSVGWKQRWLCAFQGEVLSLLLCLLSSSIMNEFGNGKVLTDTHPIRKAGLVVELWMDTILVPICSGVLLCNHYIWA